MSLNKIQRTAIEQILKDVLRSKFKKYKRETAPMPFHTRLLGKDRYALYSFIQSLNTTFGTSVFEPVAVTLAQTRFPEAKRQEKAGNRISRVAQAEIQEIMDDLTAGRAKPDKKREIERIRRVCQSGEMVEVKPTVVDVFVQTDKGVSYLFDIKTAKPNKGSFKAFKRTLLEWTAVSLSENPDQDVQTLIAIPYNPYAPKPYSRWTMAGMLDLEQELQVAEEFWDFLGGEGAYQDLLSCFEQVGIEMREEIDTYFKRFNG